MKKTLIVIAALTAIGLTIGIPACSHMGQPPSAEESIVYKASENYQNGTFENNNPVNMTVEGFTFSKAVDFFLNTSRKPDKDLPAFHLTANSFKSESQDLQIVWLGHSSMILDIDGVRILIDPVFDNAAPVPFVVKRFQPSPIKRTELPEVDAVVISHDHYDHLEMKTIKYLTTRVKHFIVPLGVGTHLKKWGCNPEQIIELDWWQSAAIKNLEIIATPSRHFSGRGLNDRFKTQWASFVFKGDKHRAFYSGDGGYDDRFKKIGEEFGPFDLTMIESGAWDKAWKDVHLMPYQSVQAHKELGGKYMLPVHWAAYDLAFHQWDDPIRMVTKLAKQNNVQLLTPQMGKICVPGLTVHAAWWSTSETQELAAQY